jgi:hypothetical protein
MADPAMTLAIRLARRNAVLLTEIAQPDSAATRQSKGRREAVQLIGYLPTNSEQCGPST